MVLVAYGGLDLISSRPGTTLNLGVDTAERMTVEASLTHTFCRDDCEVEAMRREVHAKLRPMAGSFYFNFGYGVEELIWDPSDESSAASDQVAVHTMSKGATFSLGNLWRPGGIAIGADWIGFFRPLSARILETRTTEYYDTTQEESTKERAEAAALQSTVWICKFHLGIVF